MRYWFIFLFVFKVSLVWAQPVSWCHEETGSKDLSDVSFDKSDLSEFLNSKISYPHPMEFSRVNIVYDGKGNYLGSFVNYSAPIGEPKGFIVFGPADKDNLAKTILEQSGVQTFKFNDPIQDLRKYPPSYINLAIYARIPNILEKSGVTANFSVAGRYKFAASEGSDKMDYFIAVTPFFILIDGYLYNPKDAGNFIWGAGMRKLGFSFPMTKIGSETNAFFFTRSDNTQGPGIIVTGDSDKDQAAIKRGYNSIFASLSETDFYTKLSKDRKTNPIAQSAWVGSYAAGHGLFKIDPKELVEIIKKNTLDQEILNDLAKLIAGQDMSEENSKVLLAICESIALNGGDFWKIFEAIKGNKFLSEDKRKALRIIVSYPEVHEYLIRDIAIFISSDNTPAHETAYLYDQMVTTCLERKDEVTLKIMIENMNSSKKSFPNYGFLLAKIRNHKGSSQYLRVFVEQNIKK